MVLRGTASYHYVSKEDFAVSVRSVRPEATDDDISTEYKAFIKDVERVQTAQIVVLRQLIKDHGIRHVYAEGLIKPIRRSYRPVHGRAATT